MRRRFHDLCGTGRWRSRLPAMFLDLRSDHGGNGISCMGCRQPIWPGEASQHIHFAPGDEHGLDRMNGLYHAACAAPFQTVIRALDALRSLGR